MTVNFAKVYSHWLKLPMLFAWCGFISLYLVEEVLKRWLSNLNNEIRQNFIVWPLFHQVKKKKNNQQNNPCYHCFQTFPQTNQPETDTWHGLLWVLNTPTLQSWKLEFGRCIACVSQMDSFMCFCWRKRRKGRGEATNHIWLRYGLHML